MHKIPKTMKAAVLYGEGDLRVVERPVPEPGGQEALVKVDSCAICGTDPKIVAHGWPNHPPYGEYIPGHEFTGTVVGLGPGASGWKIGDRVAVEPHKGCGICENCIRGLYTTCLNYGDLSKGHRHYGFTANGGYAEYAVNHINTLHKVPESVDLESATLATTAGTVIYGLERAGWVRPGDFVVVSGPGPIGLMAVQVARACGAGYVVLSGTREERLAIGRQVGAAHTVNIREKDLVGEVMALTGGKGADLVVECSGDPGAAAASIDITKKSGRISFIGIYSQPVTLALNNLVQKNIQAAGGKAEGGWALERGMPLIANGAVMTKPLITHKFRLEDINGAMDTFARRLGGAIKVVVKP